MPAAKPVYLDFLIEEIKSLPVDYTAQVLDFVGYLKEKAARQDECPVCARYRDPETGEPLYNAETKAAINEVDDMLAGKIPNTLKKFNNLEEMLKDLDSDD
ncbi:MAG: hypothetical protein FWD40_11345 [Treponema sp.]|nr:hypothetical protein [Treponema sp.]